MRPKTDRPVIMQIIPALGAGGAEQGCLDVASAIVAGGGRALVVSNGGHRIPDLLRGGGEHIQLPVNSKNPFVMWRNVQRLKVLIKQYGVHVVHARSRAPAWSAFKACQDLNVPFMTTCHAPYNTQNEMKKLYNGAIAKGERVIAISNFVAQYLRDTYNLPESVIRIIPRGIPMEKFHPSRVTSERMAKLLRSWRVPDGANIILLPGRLTRWKGQTVLIEAVAALKRKDVFTIIVGDDQGRLAYRKELEDLIAARELEGRVRLVPHCDDMPSAYALSSVVVCPSIEPEGFGRVPVEGMAMGRPVVATNIGGAAETMIDGETGWLVPPDDWEALARAIAKVMKMPQDELDAIGVRAMQHVAENFTKERMTDKTLSVYEELLSAKTRTAAGAA
jgi:glycosyltransferase involved in cell wall biosynthesis